MAMYLKIIAAFVLSFVILCKPSLALQINGNASGLNEEQIGSLKAFLESDFVRASVWPGIGPFHSSANDSHLVDPSGNQLTYSAVGKQIGSCQLELHSGSSEAQCMLNLQMSVDFLLEGLGAKPGQIHIVNSDLNKNSKLLLGNNYNPIQTTVSPFIVSLQNLGVNEGTENSIYRIVIANENYSSGNLEPNLIKKDEKNLASDAGKDALSSNEQIDEQPTAKAQPVDKSSVTKETVAVKEKQVAHIPASTKGFQSEVTEESKMDTVISVQENKPAVLSKDEQLKKDFRDVIQNWQSLKKVAVKERKTDLLSQALAGKALIRQTDAIKWLASNHKYYEMTPGGAKIDKVTALIPGKKYAVFAEVREKTKYIDDASGKVVKDTDDTYKVNYTIEKNGNKWLITDSALVKSTDEKKPVKAAGKNSH